MIQHNNKIMLENIIFSWTETNHPLLTVSAAVWVVKNRLLLVGASHLALVRRGLEPQDLVQVLTELVACHRHFLCAFATVLRLKKGL